MASRGLILDVEDMQEAVADWAEKTTGRRPSLNAVAHAGFGKGEWYFLTSPSPLPIAPKEAK